MVSKTKERIWLLILGIPRHLHLCHREDGIVTIWTDQWMFLVSELVSPLSNSVLWKLRWRDPDFTRTTLASFSPAVVLISNSRAKKWF